MIQPTTRTVILLALGLPVALLPAWFSHSLWPPFVVWNGLVAVVFVLDALALLLAGRLRVSLDAPKELGIGEFARARLSIVVSRATSSRRALVLVDLPEPWNPDRPRGIVLEEDTHEVEIELRASGRGVVPIPNVWIRRFGPLGLVSQTKRHALDHEVAVVPDLRPVRATALRFAGSHDTHSGLKVERYVGEGSEFESLRDFTPGYDPRSIDWKATARHHRLLVRETRAERNHPVILAIDTGPRMREPLAIPDIADGTRATMPRLDHAIHSALALGYAALRTGDRVGLFAFDATPHTWLDPNGLVSSFSRLRRTAAGLPYGESETNYTLAVTELAMTLKRRSLVVVFTDFVDTVTAELMIENLGRLARRHAVLFVSLRDPHLDRLVGERPIDLPGLGEAVVAADQIRERRRVIRRLRELGLQCLDVEPHRVNAALLDRYLHMKRREVVR